MKPLPVITLILVLLCVLIAVASVMMAPGGSTTTLRLTGTAPAGFPAVPAGTPVSGVPTLAVTTAPAGGVPTVTPPQGMPSTGAWGLPMDVARFFGRVLRRGPVAWRAGPAFQDDAVARLEIPAIGVNTPLLAVTPVLRMGRDGVERLVWEIPDYSAAWHATSAPFGQPGNTVISGHNNLGAMVFQKLADIHPGDGVFVQLPDGTTYAYTVRQVLVLPEIGQPQSVRDDNARYLESSYDTRLTLVSCWPDWSNTERVVVIAMP
jgi:LPXTG-site transpeptidase (sortase) family protein